MSTKFTSRRFSAAVVRANILNQKILRKITMVLALCAPLLSSHQAFAQVSLYSIPVTIQAEGFSAGNGVKNETSTDSGGGMYIGAINTGDWLDYRNHKIVIPVTGRYIITYRVSSPHTGSSFSFSNINPSGSLSRVGVVVVPNTGGLQNWTTVQQNVPLKAGPHFFTVRALSGTFTLDWIRIVAVSDANTSASSSSKVSSSKSSVASSRAVSSIAKSSVVSSSKPVSSTPATVSSRPASSVAKSSVKAVSSVAVSSKVSSSKAVSSVASTSKISSSAAVSSKASSSKAISSVASSSKVSSSKSSVASSSSKSSVSSSAPANGYTYVSGPVGLTWIAPKLREDKSELDITELGGYRLRYKSAQDSKYTYITINDPWATTYNFNWLEGSYIFEIAAFDDAGLLSDFSNFTE